MTNKWLAVVSAVIIYTTMKVMANLAGFSVEEQILMFVSAFYITWMADFLKD